MVESLQDLRVSGSNPIQTGLLYNQIPVYLYRTELTQIIQMYDAVANSVTLLHGGTFVGGDKQPPK